MASWTDGRRVRRSLGAGATRLTLARLARLARVWRLSLLALLALLALAPRPGRAAEHIVLASYQEREGLLNLTPTCLTRDQRSILWICTENGLFRFDGFRVRAEPLPGSVGTIVWGGRVDPRGRLWLTTDRGLFVRQPAGDAADGEGGGTPRWVEVLRPDGKTIDVVLDQQFDVDEHGMLVAFDRDHRYWTATVDERQAGPIRVQELPVAAHVRARGTPYVDSSPLRLRGGSLWFGCGEGLCSWDRRQPTVTQWSAGQGLPPEAWSTLFVGRDGSLWARGRKHLARLAPGGQRFEVVAAPPPNRLWEASNPIAEDPRGRIVTATDRGLARWDGAAWQEWTHEDGLPDAAMRVLLFDAGGALWLGASGQGIHRWIGYGEVDHWTRASGLPSSVVFNLLQDGSGRIWAFTRQGPAWFDAAARRFRPIRTTLATGDDVPSGAAIDAAGDLWWMDNGQLMTVKAGGTAARRVLSDPSLLALFQGHAGTVYVASDERVERLVPLGAGVRRQPVATGVPGGSPPIEVFSDGAVDWFVNARWNPFRAEGTGWVPLRDEQGALVKGISQVLLPDGVLWMTDDAGLAAYALSGSEARLRQRVSRASLGQTAPMWLGRGPDDGLWLGTDRGVFLFDGQGAWREMMDRDTGLVWNDTNSGSFLVDAAGDAWIGTSAGLTRVYGNRRPPPVPAVLRADLLEFGTLRFDAAPRDPVPWSDRQLRITLGTPAFSLARAQRVEYRLSADTPWRVAEGASIEVGALDTGRHVLEMRAGGRVPLEPPGPSLSVPVEVAPPWWDTTGMRLGYAAALAALYWLQAVWTQRRARARRRELERAIEARTAELEASQAALHRLSEYNALALEDERKRVSRELHDELGQQLAALRLEISVMRARAAKAAAAPGTAPGTEQLDLLHERVDRLVATVRSVVSQLRPPALDGGLEAALRWLASAFIRDTGLPCAVSIPVEANQLSAEAGTLMFRIVQESLNNVRRHAEASHVVVKLACHDAQWTLTVRDDGRGFSPASRSAGYGLLGMEERARLLAGSLRVLSAPGQGTTVELNVVPGAPPVPPP